MHDRSTRTSRVRRRVITGLVLVMPVFGACRRGGITVPEYPEGTTRVLFVGNSFTYTNDVPGMMDAIARQLGDAQIRHATIASPNVSLEDHWVAGGARQLLTARKWDYVVMQQGPSSLPENQALLAEWSAWFEPLIRAAGATPVLYQVWPAQSRPQDAPAVQASYRNAAARVGGIFAPAGTAWYEALRVDPAIGVYASDGLHQSRRGAYLSALVLLSRIRNVEPEAFPRSIPGSGDDSTVVAALQAAAASALRSQPARP